MTVSETAIERRWTWRLRLRSLAANRLIRRIGAVLLVFLLFQFCLMASLWRESVVRQRLMRKGFLTLQGPRLPSLLDWRVRSWIGDSRVDLIRHVVDFRLHQPVDADLQNLALLRRVEYADIHSGKLTSTGLKQIHSLHFLKSLYVENLQFDDDSLAGLPTCRRLQHMKLVGPIRDGALRPLGQCETLTDLSLETDSLTEAHVADVARILGLKRLVIQADVSGNSLRPLANAASLQELYVSAQLIDDDSLESFSRIPRLSRLVIDFAAEESTLRRRMSGFQHLQTLAIYGVNVQTGVFADLPELQTLVLRSCMIRGPLSRLADVQSLRRLDLYLSNVAPDRILELGNHDRLQTICLGGFHELTTDQLRSRFPRLKNQDAESYEDGEICMPNNWHSYAGYGIGGGGGFF